MGTYNILKTEIECPRCNQIVEQKVDLYFSYTNEMLEYKIGDKYLWRLGKEVQNGGRPKMGNLTARVMSNVSYVKKAFL